VSGVVLLSSSAVWSILTARATTSLDIVCCFPQDHFEFRSEDNFATDFFFSCLFKPTMVFVAGFVVYVCADCCVTLLATQNDAQRGVLSRLGWQRGVFHIFGVFGDEQSHRHNVYCDVSSLVNLVACRFTPARRSLAHTYRCCQNVAC
jgi:hypothetical protein